MLFDAHYLESLAGAGDRMTRVMPALATVPLLPVWAWVCGGLLCGSVLGAADGYYHYEANCSPLNSSCGLSKRDLFCLSLEAEHDSSSGERSPPSLPPGLGWICGAVVFDSRERTPESDCPETSPLGVN